MLPTVVSKREFVRRLILAELLARPGEGPLARKSAVPSRTRVDEPLPPKQTEP